jgi:hypothetical protein
MYMNCCANTMADSLSIARATRRNCSQSSAFLTLRLNAPSGTLGTTGNSIIFSSIAMLRRLPSRVRGVAMPFSLSNSPRTPLFVQRRTDAGSSMTGIPTDGAFFANLKVWCDAAVVSR